MATIDLHARINAPRETVWGVLTDSDGWADWGDFTHSVRLAEGQGHPDGLGAVREIWTAGVVPTRERVVTFDADRGDYEYVMTAGPPLRDYRGRVRLERDGEGTAVHWTASFRPPLPLPGADLLLSRVFGVILGRLLKGLTEESERRATTPPLGETFTTTG